MKLFKNKHNPSFPTKSSCVVACLANRPLCIQVEFKHSLPSPHPYTLGEWWSNENVHLILACERRLYHLHAHSSGWLHNHEIFKEAWESDNLAYLFRHESCHGVAPQYCCTCANLQIFIGLRFYSWSISTKRMSFKNF